MDVGRVRGARAPDAAQARRGMGGTFRVVAEPDAAPAITAAAAPPALDGLLGLQEQEAAWSHDRPARQHAQSLLDELAALQRRLLAGDDDPAALRRLRTLCTAMPGAVDAGLAALLRACALRAAVELSRAAVM